MHSEDRPGATVSPVHAPPGPRAQLGVLMGPGGRIWSLVTTHLNVLAGVFRLWEFKGAIQSVRQEGGIQPFLSSRDGDTDRVL